MNGPTTPIVEVALSEAQRGILTRPLGIPSHAFYPAAAHRACRALGELGLLSETRDNVENVMWRFTPLGLAVRAHLLSTQVPGPISNERGDE